MATIVLEKIKQPLFNLFYVMTEGSPVDAGFSAYRNTVFLLFIDVLQIVRVMCSQQYGWTEETQGVVEKTDLVYDLTNLISNLIPRYFFFILAATLVLIALADSYFVIKLFRAGNVQKLWPVKLLRYLVMSLVTIFFISIFNWLLMPISCLASKEKSFSDFVHDKEDICTPWGMPEMLISIPAILLGAAYVFFALGTSYLAFEINPLSRNPRAMYTGRVEMLFTCHKVAVTVLVFLADLVTPVVICIVFFLWSFYVFRQHLRILPFHSEVTNNLRGGMFGMMLWWSLASIITSAVHIARHDTWETEEHPSWVQPLQWALAGLLPLAFGLGLSLTAFTQYRVSRSLLRLRGDFEKPANIGSDMGADDGKHRKANSDDMHLPSAHVPRIGVKRGVFEKFFDTEWESRRRFANEWRAGVLLRSLLHRRNKEDMLFMQYLVGRAIQEHPESMLLQLQLLVLHRFVFRDASEAAEIQRALKLDQKTLPIDCQYILFVAERKSNSAMRGPGLGGGGSIAGIRLMEFDISFERARKAHLACVSKMRVFWRQVEKKRTACIDPLQAMDLVKALDEYEQLADVAKKEYDVLVEKYPQSVQLLRSYAHFCDTVLNDIKKSEQFQKNATLLEGDDEEIIDEEEEEGGSRENPGNKEFPQEKEGGGSTYSSEAEPYRVYMQRYLLSQSDLMMGHEARAMQTLHRRVGLALLLLIVITTSGFVLNDNYLFSGLALNNMDQIDKTGLLRSYALNTAYLLRGMQIAAIYNDTAWYEHNERDIAGMMSTWRERHRSNYESMSSKLKDYYLKSELMSYVPVEGIWTIRHSNFWTLGNEYARRSERAAQTHMEDMKNPSFRLGTMSYEKENVAYVFENLERETRKDLRVVVDFFQEEMEQFGILATALMIGNVCINALLVLLISFIVLRALTNEMRTMQSSLVFCTLALSLPRSTANAIYKYYDTVELNLKIIEDEDAERAAVMQSDVNVRRKSSITGADGLPTALSRRRSSAQSDDNKPAMNEGMMKSVPGNIGRRPSSIMRPPSTEPMYTVPLVNGPESPLGLQDDGAVSGGSSPANVGAAKPSANVMRWLTRDPEDARGGEEGPQGDEELGNDYKGESDEEQEERKGPGRGVWGNRRDDEPVEFAAGLGKNSGRKEASGVDEGHSKRNKKGEGGWSKRGGRATPSDDEEDEEIENSAVLRSPGPADRGRRPSPMRRSQGDEEESHHSRGGRGSRRNAHGEEEEWSKRSVTLAAPEEAVEWAAMTEGVLRMAREKVRRNIAHRLHDKDKDHDGSPFNERRAKRGHREEHVEVEEKKTVVGRLFDRVMSWGAAPKVPLVAPVDAGDGRPENFLEDSRDSLAAVVQKQQPWHTRVEVYFAVCFVVLTICIFSMVYPARHIGSIVNLAPVANQAGRRRSLATSCVHYSRELVLNDGFSRMTKEESAGALRFYLEALREADTAVRLGGAAGIRVGSDYRNQEHNDVMYGEGCEWREDPSDCRLKGHEGRQDVAKHGLSYLLKSFEDAVEKVLARYGPGLGDNLEWQEHRPEVATADMFAEVHTDLKRMDLLTSDPDLKFVMEGFDGDVPTGLGKMLSIFHEETSHVLQTSQTELRLLFGVYVSIVILVFYSFLFRRTIRFVLAQVDRTRGLVLSMPTHVLKKENVQAIVHFFAPQNNNADEDDHEEERTGRGRSNSVTKNGPTEEEKELEQKRADLARKMAELQAEQTNLKGVV